MKDPVGLQYFRFEEEEFAILQMLDGHSSLDDIAERFEARVSAANDPHRRAAALHRHAAPQRPGDHRRRRARAVQLKERRDEKKRKELLAALSNILSFRFKGIDPERILNWLYPYIRWFFTPAAMTVAHHARSRRR